MSRTHPLSKLPFRAHTRLNSTERTVLTGDTLPEWDFGSTCFDIYADSESLTLPLQHVVASMSAFEPIVIDDSNTRQAGASLHEDDVLNFEGGDMPFSQLDTTSGGGNEAGFGTTLVPATFFYQPGAEADAFELESYPGVDPMFLGSGEY